MKKLILAAVIAASLSTAAFASPVFNESFDSASFRSGSLGLTGSEASSDNWSVTNYYNINSTNGWSFSAGTYLATNDTVTNGAVLLNENGGSATKLVTGLNAGQNYTLTFNVFGDNRPNQAYGLNVSVDGIQKLSFSNVTDKAAGFYNGAGGVLQTINFTASGTGAALLNFTQTSSSAASPIIDNVSIAAAVPEPETYAMLLAGLGLIGSIARRRNQEK
jgi:hypothetical protein